ncbi:hypothetical protein RIF29_18891 [Crotalaria pallida]|uniref:Uncharacterized protein n=1 Tax=Crotalaria pallida TaxID=3830 RepID=A0AAN9EYI3_CROPI
MEGKSGERKTSPLSHQSQNLNNFHSHFFIHHHQQHEAQKMMDLKKAYAEVILNTAKEAATRVMASEQRAIRFQHELAASKDEALRMLLRLKQMMDAKTAEADMTSLNQHRKIQELEAQLNEAEDIITDLRAELTQVWHELEKAKNRQVRSFEGQNVTQVAAFEENAKPETLVSSRDQELEYVTLCDVKNKSLTENDFDDKYGNSTKETEKLCISSLEDSNSHDSDFASIIMRSKEHELCKNGCTQRIRALEGKLLDKKLHTQDVNSQHFGLENGPIDKDNDGHVAKLRESSAKTKKMEIKKCHKKRRTFSSCRSCFPCKIHLNKTCKAKKGACSLRSINLCAISKWKRRLRHARMKSSVLEHCKPLFVLKHCSSVCDNLKCSEDEYVAKNTVPPLTDIEPMHGSTGVRETVQAVNSFEPVEKAAEKENELLNFEGSASQNLTDKFEVAEKATEKDNELLNFEGSSAENLTVPSSNMKVEVVDIPSTKTDLEDTKTLEENDGSRSPEDQMLLKYTFQRKRKKVCIGNPDEKTDSKKTVVKRRVEKKQNDSLEPQKF